jgi:hypothetical protein
MSYMQPLLPFYFYHYSRVASRYRRVEFDFIKNPPVNFHGRMFKPESLSVRDEGEGIAARTGI